MRAGSGSAPPGGPVFIAGGDRSGLGLLGELLERHPTFSISRRTNFFARYHDRFGDLADRKNLAAALAEMGKDRRYRLFDLDLARVDKALGTTKRNYPGLFEVLAAERMARLGRTRWGDKSLWSESYADEILGAYPTGRMVQVIRDPRDQFASFKYHRKDGDVSPAVGAAMWRRSMRAARRNLVRHGGRYAVMRYEDLVADPRREMTQLCRFLGVDYCEEMFEDPVSGDKVTIHDGSVGRHRQDLDAVEVGLIERPNRKLMVEFGYEPDHISPGWRMAPALVQMAAWGARARVRRRRVPRRPVGHSG